MSDPSRWLIGVDVGGHSRGALQMASWLVRASHAPVELVAVHVIDEHVWGSRAAAEALVPSAEAALQRELATMVLRPHEIETRILIAPSVVDGLAGAALELGCDGMIVGRLAASRAHALIRLGSIARRVLRRLPVPVLVVPPDISSGELGTGGVLLATDLADESLAAARLAQRIAGGLDRPLVVCHVHTPYPMLSNDASGDPIVARTPRHTETQVEAWAHHSGIAAPHVRLCEGDIVERIISEARRESAAMIVVGSRRLSLGARILTSSVGSDLARLADRPVLIVPPASSPG